MIIPTYIDKASEAIIIPKYAYDLLKDVHVSDEAEVRKLVREYIQETDDILVDWFDFQRWVANSILSY